MRQRTLRMPEGMLDMLPAHRPNIRLHNPQQSSNVFYKIYLALAGFHSHTWIYDAESLAEPLCSAGFLAGQEIARVLSGEGICVKGIKLPLA
ncbi:MAG TPA: hypothetical protein VOA41_06865 [Candidatus Dormibacteraeota bacterium]|nr:hypothetical protein [Candidatus Dormibacteraeota bacterium]